MLELAYQGESEAFQTRVYNKSNFHQKVRSSCGLCFSAQSFKGPSNYPEVAFKKFIDRIHRQNRGGTYTKHGPGSMDHPMDLVLRPGPWTTPLIFKRKSPLVVASSRTLLLKLIAQGGFVEKSPLLI